MSTNYIRVTVRDIAKMLCKELPLQGNEYTNAVNDYIDAIDKLNHQSKLALKSAFLFASKAPKADRQDLFQELFLKLFEAKAKDEKLAYAIARCDWSDWWDKYYHKQKLNVTSLNAVKLAPDGNEYELGELLVGEAEFEAKMCAKLDASAIWQKLPAEIKSIVQRRLQGFALNRKERDTLYNWNKKIGYEFVLAPAKAQ
jgi:DNA-directed RNA polymerase specialized sigma24 family protein